jgi:hypothetical protein
MTNLLFKTYFQVGTFLYLQTVNLTNRQINAVGLSKNLLRALSAQAKELPDLEDFPKSHVVTFKYFVGVIYFLDENYGEV